MPDRTSQDVTKHNKEKAIYVLISSYYYGRRAPLRKTPPEIPDEILGGWSATRKLSRNRLLGNRSSLVANGRLTRSRLGSPSVSTAKLAPSASGRTYSPIGCAKGCYQQLPPKFGRGCGDRGTAFFTKLGERRDTMAVQAAPALIATFNMSRGVHDRQRNQIKNQECSRHNPSLIGGQTHATAVQ
jgi:hypothetical protein